MFICFEDIHKKPVGIAKSEIIGVVPWDSIGKEQTFEVVVRGLEKRIVVNLSNARKILDVK